MNMTIRNLPLFLLIGAASLCLGACAAVHQVGEGTEQVGEKIQEEAEGHMDPNDRDDPDEEDNS